jgi:ribonuclease P protein component
LRRRADFDRVFRQGRHHSSRLMALRSVANGGPLTRLAVSASKRVGNAVVRNRVRRRLKEAFRCLPLNEGYDIVIVPRPEAAKASFGALKEELTLLLKRGRLLAEP